MVSWAEDRRDIIFQFIANTTITSLSKLGAQGLSNLAYAYGLIEYAPKLEDGSALFDHLAEKSMLLLGKFKPQAFSNTVWSFEKAGVSHPLLFERVADHIVGLRQLDDFIPQNLSIISLSYAKAGETHPCLFEKIAVHIVALDSLR